MMEFDYKYKIEINKPFNVDFIKYFCAANPDKKLLVEVQNTKGITSAQIRQLDEKRVSIRIAGGYDDERINHNGKLKFKNGETGQYYTDAVIYTRNETIKILEEIEKIEKGISENWSEFQKLIYIYQKLKSKIMYDPKYEKRSSKEVRSLRGLVTNQTVCAGFSLILKEMLDRQGIKCEYVEGYTTKEKTRGHAWNIVTINGKKYPIDLTWDNANFRSGKFNTYDFLGQDIMVFSQEHFPESWAPTQNYEKTLSEIDPNFIKQISSPFKRVSDYNSTTYEVSRKDGTKFLVAQIGNKKIGETNYYRYYYIDIQKDGTKSNPLILYGETNITKFIDIKNFNPNKIKNIDLVIHSIAECMFSKKNIDNSLKQKTFYIGKIVKNKINNVTEYIKTPEEIQKTEEKKLLFVYPTKTFTRSDGTIFIAQQMIERPLIINGIEILKYDILEIIEDNDRNILKRNTIFTEKNFFDDQRQSMVDVFLSRSRIDRKNKEAGGYIGYYDENGNIICNEELVSYFDTSKKVDINLFDKQVQIPTFDELKFLASKYELHIDLEDGVIKPRIVNIDTGETETNVYTIVKAIFANIWLFSAGVKYMYNERRPGFYYAFDEYSEEFYYIICDELLKSIKTTGAIDTISLYKNIENKSIYKYSHEIIVNLFRSDFQSEFINSFFSNSIGVNSKGKKIYTLYSLENAGNLARKSNKKK